MVVLLNFDDLMAGVDYEYLKIDQTNSEYYISNPTANHLYRHDLFGLDKTGINGINSALCAIIQCNVSC